jgi:hypothetical protein
MKVGRAAGTKNRKFAECHPDRKHYSKGMCRACYKAPYMKRYKEEGRAFPSHSPEARKEASLKLLGWTLDLFNKTLIEQDNKCAICEKEVNLSKVQNSSRACADHLHVDPPVPRGILCTICNAMIGHALENPRILRAAASYIEKFSLETPAEATKLTVSAKMAGM